MTDLLGRELNVGDTVVFSLHRCHTLGVARIDHFAKKMVVMDVTTRFGKLIPMSEGNEHNKAICRYPGDCVKVEVSND